MAASEVMLRILRSRLLSFDNVCPVYTIAARLRSRADPDNACVPLLDAGAGSSRIRKPPDSAPGQLFVSRVSSSSNKSLLLDEKLNAPLTYSQRVSPGPVDIQGSSFPSLTAHGRSSRSFSGHLQLSLGIRLPTTSVKYEMYETGT